MSLKRKAPFASAIPSSPLAPPPSEWDDTSNHLHSRTRKRFRDDRPSDKIVYEKTLRWIFSAQQQQQQQTAAMDTSDETMDSESMLPTPETIDPRQQTLLRFFQPRTQPGSPFRPSRHALAPRANETAMEHDEILRRQVFNGMNPAVSSTTSETTSPGNNMDVDMDVDMDTEETSDGSYNASKPMAWM
ncbi:hypothetical protein N7492_009031 [Penicillium capsulatum]|uniref:Uncharacterized protein n=1 Tax=Penicillium capsulatum TaxID=69766 RepID=A0A9W9HTA0_9EURO|nr:hypothetical protein N7492_009031 [Penicillium capsulatum]KAJ6106430.1 hypothetical protein N7512_009947 [Penicillium capsulatum]